MSYLFSSYFDPEPMEPIDYVGTFPTLPYKLCSMSQWEEWYATLRMGCEGLSLWHKVDPDLPSSPENDFFKSPVMISEQEYCDKLRDPEKHGLVDHYLYTFHEKVAKVATRQCQLDAVRLWIAYSVNIQWFLMATDVVRDNLKTSLAEKRDKDKEEEDYGVPIRLLVRYLRDRLSPRRM
ncbi:hypothetical protein E4U48_002481 [Claviceps purpurea]|nr:hypothetical protein E4U12_007336 [Claviceps purpurea]KAG6274801.1 hypothetical protein E4U48_002481 [Claviceps purpurea]